MKKFLRFFAFALSALSCLLIFLAGNPLNVVPDENDPLIDRPTKEWYSHWEAFQDDGNLDLITDAQGFDNQEVGYDNAEQIVMTNPQNPLWIFVGANGAGSPVTARWSTNGGINWALTNPSIPGGSCCDPWAAYTGNGRLIFGSLHTGIGQHVYTSTNNGQSWSLPVVSVSGSDRNTLAAEETGTGPYANYVYAAITPGNFAVSTDLGATWSTTFGASNNVPGVMIAVGPNGAVNGGCVIYVTNTGSTQNVTYTFHRTTDGGTTFTTMSSLSVAGYVGSLNSVGRLVINNARTRPYPMIAMDNSNGPYRGRLYLVYASNEPAGDGNKPDIKLQYSTDQGASWSSYITVNDNPNPALSDQWFPAIWCERTTGKLYIKWYDDRENPAAYQTGVWATYSTTGGTSFVPSQKISNASFTYPCPSCNPNTNCYRGDYDAITANSKVSYAVWYDGRICLYASMGAYFPDYAMKVLPSVLQMNGLNDSQFVSVSIPAVKLYTDTVMFSGTITPAPGTGTFDISFIDKTNNGITRNLLTAYPDSVRCRVKTSGGVTAGNYTLRIQTNGPNGTPVHTRNVNLTVSPIGISTIGNEIPSKYYLFQNYPNPFNPTTNIRFDLAKSGFVKIAVFDVTGRQVAELVNGTFSAGKYVTDYKADGISSGIYFYRIETADYINVKKMIVVK